MLHIQQSITGCSAHSQKCSVLLERVQSSKHRSQNPVKQYLRMPADFMVIKNQMKKLNLEKKKAG